jgi:NitT/TauT family transport system substrate-binding protein
MWQRASRVAPGLLAACLFLVGACAAGSPASAPGAATPPPASASAPTVTGAALAPVAPPSPPEPLRVVHVVRSGAMGPLWVAYEDGIFARHGIDAELRYIASGTLGAQALLAREVDIGVVAASSAAAANLNGGDAIYLGALQRTFALWVYTLPEITTPAELRGKRVGFTRRGSTADVALSHYLDRYGLRLDRDVFVAELGDSAAAIPALASGAVQGAIFSDPASFLARRQGYYEMADLGQLGVEYPQSALVTTRTFATERRGLVERFLRAVVEATHRYKTDRELGLRVLGKYLGMDDTELLAEIYDLYAGRLLQNVPRASYEGTRNLLEELATQYDQARGADPARFLDTSFVEALEREGIEERLYGK